MCNRQLIMFFLNRYLKITKNSAASSVVSGMVVPNSKDDHIKNRPSKTSRSIVVIITREITLERAAEHY